MSQWLAVMELSDLQPLTVYNEHTPGAHGHSTLSRPVGGLYVNVEVVEGGMEGQETQVVMLGGTHGSTHQTCCGSTSVCRSSSVSSSPCGGRGRDEDIKGREDGCETWTLCYSAALHPRELRLIYLNLCSATLHFGVPEWLKQITCMMHLTPLL